MPRLLDLFCGEGGAGTGYARAGWDVVGVDSDERKLERYPYPRVHGDALDYLERYGSMFDAVHASPPCKVHTDLAVLHPDAGHVDLVAPTRRLLQATGLPYVIENVEGAPLDNPMTLCGSQFGLEVDCRDGQRRWLRRHRLFESSVFLVPPGPCMHPDGQPVGVYGTGGGGQQTRGYKAHPEEARQVMGMPWGSRDGVAQAIPPAFTQWIGAQLLEHLAVAA